MVDTEKFYTCKSDRAFKEVFMKEESKDILAKVLETVLKVEIKDIKFLNLERNVGNIHIRKKYFDLFLDTNIGKIQLEVNADYDKSKKIRNTAFICDTFSHVTLKGKEYTDDILIIQINFSYENVKDEYITKMMIRDEEGESYINNFIIYDINMVKCRNLWYTKDESLKEYKYLTMLDLEELSKKDEVISKYMETLEEVNQDPEFREYMSMEEDAIKMENSHISRSIRQGIQQGIEKITKNMLEENMDINLISKLTGLSEEEINSLK